MGNEAINEDNDTQNTATGQSGALWLKKKKKAYLIHVLLFTFGGNVRLWIKALLRHILTLALSWHTASEIQFLHWLNIARPHLFARAIVTYGKYCSAAV